MTPRAKRGDGGVVRIALRVTATALALVAWACGSNEPAVSTDSAAVAQTAVAPAAEHLLQRCVSCHQANGAGLPGSHPPLAGSAIVNAANVDAPILVTLFGMQGPMTARGARFDGVMLPYGSGLEMSDAEVAALLTHVRRSWGNSSGAITAEDVARVRAANAGSGPVTEATLKKVMCTTLSGGPSARTPASGSSGAGC